MATTKQQEKIKALRTQVKELTALHKAAIKAADKASEAEYKAETKLETARDKLYNLESAL